MLAVHLKLTQYCKATILQLKKKRVAITRSRDLGRPLIFPALTLVLSWFFGCQLLLWVQIFMKRWSLLEINSFSHILFTEKREKYAGLKSSKDHLSICLTLYLLSFERKFWWAPNIPITKYDGFKRIEYENFIMFKLSDLWKLPQTTIRISLQRFYDRWKVVLDILL